MSEKKCPQCAISIPKKVSNFKFVLSIIIVLSVLFVGIVGAEPLSFRKFKMGMPKAEVESKINSSQCRQDYCAGKFDIKGISVQVVFSFINGTLEDMFFLFNPADYEPLKNALIEKYGKPSEIKEMKLENRMGGSYDNELTSWELRDGEVMISRYTDTINNGGISIKSRACIKYEIEKKKKDKAKPGF